MGLQRRSLAKALARWSELKYTYTTLVIATCVISNAGLHSNNYHGALQVYHSMLEAGRGVVQQHGFKGLYRGLNITLLEIIPYAALQFGLYDTFTAAWSKARRRRLTAKVKHK